jgi:ribosomal-protein-alanine N-acetyltransferase
VADIDAVYAVNGDPVACEHNPSDLLTSRADAADLFHRWDLHWRRHGFGYRTVLLRAGGPPIGFTGVKFVQLGDQTVLNLFYRFAPATWGHGYAAEAAGAVLAEIAEGESDLPVVARIRPGNTASRRVAERIGLRRAPELDNPGEDGPDWIFTR